jgi:hypothetical protein
MCFTILVKHSVYLYYFLIIEIYSKINFNKVEPIDWNSSNVALFRTEIFKLSFFNRPENFEK